MKPATKLRLVPGLQYRGLSRWQCHKTRSPTPPHTPPAAVLKLGRLAAALSSSLPERERVSHGRPPAQVTPSRDSSSLLQG